MATSRTSVAKLCPRCGAFYQDLASKTCPQCFAILEELSDAEAASLIAEQESRSRDPEYLQAKTQEDEQFKEQAFGACLSVAAVAVLTVVVSVVIIIVAIHRQTHYASMAAPALTQPAPAHTLLPNDFNQIIPPHLAGFTRTEADADFALPGTIIRVYHGQYGDAGQVYAVPGGAITDSQASTFRLAVDFAAQQHQPPLLEKELTTPAGEFIVVAKDAATIAKMTAAVPQSSD